MTLRPLFLYGTLRDPDILAAVLGRTVSGDDLATATAPDCAAVYYPDRVYPALVQRIGSVAPGLLLAATTDDLAALDAFEGDEYRRQTITVRLGAAEQRADAYLPVIAISDDAPVWSLANWTVLHKPAILEVEIGLATSLRQRLSARRA